MGPRKKKGAELMKGAMDLGGSRQLSQVIEVCGRDGGVDGVAWGLGGGFAVSRPSSGGITGLRVMYIHSNNPFKL
jgi:hypothetical protein